MFRFRVHQIHALPSLTTYLPKFNLISAFSNSTKQDKVEPLKHANIRIVWKEPSTNKSEWKILSKNDADTFAKGKGMILVLVDAKPDPPVYKLQGSEVSAAAASKPSNTTEERNERKEQEKTKPKTLKEIVIGALIDPHDLSIKMKKLEQFIRDGHPVKITVTAKKNMLRKSPSALSDATTKLLTCLDSAGLRSCIIANKSSNYKNEMRLEPKAGSVGEGANSVVKEPPKPLPTTNNNTSTAKCSPKPSSISSSAASR